MDFKYYFIFGVCIYVDVCGGMWRVLIYVCAHACRGQRLGVSTLVFESEGLSLSLESLVWLDWLAGKFQESSHVCLSSSGIISARYHTQLLM